MPDTINRSRLDALKDRLEGIINSSGRVPQQLGPAIRDLLTAINYADMTLMASSLNVLFDGLRLLVGDIIQKELGLAKITKEGIQEGWQGYIDGHPRENFDEAKKVIESFIDERITNMTGVRDELVKFLEAKEYQVENAKQLEDGIRDLRKFRENILKDWPLPNKPPSPINRQAIAEARDAIRRGEKGMRKDELIWEKRSTDKSG